MHPKPSIPRTLVAGLAGGVAFVLGTFVTFAQLSGSRRGDEGLLFDPTPSMRSSSRSGSSWSRFPG